MKYAIQCIVDNADQEIDQYRNVHQPYRFTTTKLDAWESTILNLANTFFALKEIVDQISAKLESRPLATHLVL